MDLAVDLEDAMRRAVELSRVVLGTTSPNPPVGAVVLGADGSVLGEGATEPPGGRHAEIVALAGVTAPHTMVVTLEPCHHSGRTGPCTGALISAGVKQVVFACDEPTELAAGGAAALRSAGIEVAGGLLADEVAAGPLAAWLHRQRTGRPMVTWKLAATLDGRSAAADGTSRWITGAAARADVHRLRAESDAVVVGIGTVLADDPALTVRPDPGHQPLRVVLDSSGRTPAYAKVRSPEAETLLVTGVPVDEDTLVLPGPDGIDLPELLAALDGRGVVSVLLEGGPTVAGAFLRAGLVDRVVGYLAPALLGAGPSALHDAGVGTIDEAIRLQLEDVTRIGEDVRLTMVRRA